MNELDKVIEKNGIKTFKEAKVVINGDGIKVSNIVMGQEIDLLKKIDNEFLAAMNAIESFSTYFISGVADEAIAYKTVGTTFLASTKRLAPEFLYLCSSGYYQNTKDLMLLWGQRFEKQRIAVERAKLEEEGEKIKEKHIKPIGTL
ncbi:hypothetical protein [Pelagicoccus enzymogenes]|uniref:hypothetical protein n=1 Tax=Pelagicoccus enzymogenes TaxID=2773457 RepID=UPI00281280ED|nr:hypothetical protein [Pelagicoccus enzymogenes]